MQVLIISGFLGAGKTTFIKELLKHTNKEIAILENELGDISVDTDTLKEDDSQEEINIWELTEGCICCSTKGNFASTILNGMLFQTCSGTVSQVRRKYILLFASHATARHIPMFYVCGCFRAVVRAIS